MRLQVDFHLKLMTLTTTTQVEHAEQEAGIVGAGSARVSRGRGRGAYTGGRKNARRGSSAGTRDGAQSAAQAEIASQSSKARKDNPFRHNK